MRVGHDCKGDRKNWQLAKLEVQEEGSPPITNFDLPPEARPCRHNGARTQQPLPAAARRAGGVGMSRRSPAPRAAARLRRRPSTQGLWLRPNTPEAVNGKEVRVLESGQKPAAQAKMKYKARSKRRLFFKRGLPRLSRTPSCLWCVGGAVRHE